FHRVPRAHVRCLSIRQEEFRFTRGRRLHSDSEVDRDSLQPSSTHEARSSTDRHEHRILRLCQSLHDYTAEASCTEPGRPLLPRPATLIAELLVFLSDTSHAKSHRWGR